MKPTSPQLQALLATRQFMQADGYTFAGGNLGNTVIRYTSGGGPITCNGLLYASGGAVGPFFDRKDNKAKITQNRGTTVDQIIIDMMPGTSTIFGMSWQQALRWKYFDGCYVTVERFYMPIGAYGDTTRGSLIMFKGRMGDVDIGRSIVTFAVNSDKILLNNPYPRDLFDPGCVNTLGDARCGVNVNSYTGTGTINASTTTALLQASGLGAFASGYFARGKVLFTSGAMNGLSFSVASFTPGTTSQLTTVDRMPTTASIGDTFTAFAGCNLSLTDSNGCPKFANTANFRGFPAVPNPGVAV